MSQVCVCVCGCYVGVGVNLEIYVFIISISHLRKYYSVNPLNLDFVVTIIPCIPK